MIEAFAILKDTPIPTLMVLGGFALLVLSVATRISDKIELAPERQQSAWIAGLVLVVIGSILFLVRPGENTVTPSTIQTGSATQPMIVCSDSPDHFSAHWQAHINQLGCPLSNGSGEMVLTRQEFERGRMIGREDLTLIYALLDEHTYQKLQDTWNESQAEYSCPETSPSETPPTPRKGFGKAWCSSETLRAMIGFTTGIEETYGVVWQNFEGGAIFEIYGEIYLLDQAKSTWELLN